MSSNSNINRINVVRTKMQKFLISKLFVFLINFIRYIIFKCHVRTFENRLNMIDYKMIDIIISRTYRI